MKIKSILIGLSLVIIVSCSTSEEIPIQEFFVESFADLSITDVANVETPYESYFNKSKTGGRVEDGFQDLADIAAKLAEIFPDADILEVDVEQERGMAVWTFKVKMTSGGIVKFKFVQELGEIIKMKGKHGPFDYEINPGGSFIPFSKAMALALETVGGEVKSWSLELEEDNEWEWEFHIVSGDMRYEVEIKGFEEEVISVKEKGDDEDEDNDGDDEGEDEDEDEKEHDNVEVTDSIRDYINSIFDGEVKYAEMKEGDHGTFWKIYMINDEESVIKISLHQGDEINLVEIEGERGPFNYNVEPGMDLLDLDEVLEDVYRETENGELAEWELEIEKINSEESIWVYEFKVRGNDVKYEIEINAESGEFIKFEIHD